MKKIWIAVFAVAAIGIFFAFKKISPKVAPSPSPKPIDFIASFEILENGKKKDFSEPKYFNLTDYAYISSLDPQFIHLKKSGVTWRRFFEIHQIKIENKARFTLNNLEDSEALNKEISPGAKLLIKYD